MCFSDSPPKPTVQMFKEQMEVKVQEEVLEGSSMCLRCSAKTLCSSSPPTLTWSSTDRLHLNENSRLQLDQQKQTEIISDLNFTATHLQHEVTFICTITYKLQQRNTTAQNNTTLRVQYAPKNTSVSVFPSNSVLEGSSVTLICRSDGNPAVFNYTWYKENGGQLQTGYNLTFNDTDHTHTGRYYCKAKNQHGTQNTSMFLDVKYSPKHTSLSVFPSNSVLEGNSVTLICSSDGNPAVFNYTWYRENGGQLQTGSNLTFNVTDRTHTGRYYCQAKNQHGTQNTSVWLDIQYAPQISDSFSCTHGDVKVFTCEVHGNPSPKVEWHLSERPVTKNTSIREERLSSTDLRSFISLHQSLTHKGTLQCVTINTHGNASIRFHLFQDTTWFNINSLLVGFGVGALVMALLCLTICMYNRWICWTGREDTTGLILDDKAIQQENDEPVYANKVMQSPARDTTLDYPESLHYSTIIFKNKTTASGENRGASSLVTDSAVIKHGGVLGADIKHAESKNRNKSAPNIDDLYAKIQHRHYR
ncbi:sialic acid-binding Ig-like lectin 10 [Misgurnus anguillicaudatus]|uniref:sialic acid-binding Ig-like lectin 10 n=1 Tax=Misgurnus anguillicaudatus TaxID=75329 RepID=UPI003CCF68A6